MGEQVTLQEGFNQKFYLNILHQKVFCTFTGMEKRCKMYQQCKLLAIKHNILSSLRK